MRSFVLRALTVVAAAAMFASCSSAPKITAGWDRNVDFSGYHTWSWRDDGSIRDAAWKQRFRSVLTDELAKRKLERSDTSSDLWAVAHVRLSSETQVVSYSPAWGYAWGGWAAAYYPIEYQIPVGTIVLDLVDVRQKKLVWRGIAEGSIRENRTNEEREEKLIQILDEMFATYPGAPTAAPASPSASRP